MGAEVYFIVEANQQARLKGAQTAGYRGCVELRVDDIADAEQRRDGGKAAHPPALGEGRLDLTRAWFGQICGVGRAERLPCLRLEAAAGERARQARVQGGGGTCSRRSPQGEQAIYHGGECAGGGFSGTSSSSRRFLGGRDMDGEWWPGVYMSTGLSR